MTESERPAGDPPEPTDFDWASPRWRDADTASQEDQRRRRFRGNVAPRQRGAIDAGGSVPSSTDVEPTGDGSIDPAPPEG